MPRGYDETMSAVARSERTQRLDAQLRALPDQPGVYMFRGGKGEVLYVGKAKSLRSGCSRTSAATCTRP